MSKRSEHGGGEAASKRFVEECTAEEEETADRRLRSAMAQAAMHEIDRIIQEENERCPVIEQDREELLPPNYD